MEEVKKRKKVDNYTKVFLGGYCILSILFILCNILIVLSLGNEPKLNYIKSNEYRLLYSNNEPLCGEIRENSYYNETYVYKLSKYQVSYKDNYVNCIYEIDTIKQDYNELNEKIMQEYMKTNGIKKELITTIVYESRSIKIIEINKGVHCDKEFNENFCKYN